MSYILKFGLFVYKVKVDLTSPLGYLESKQLN